jgi:hypothetical protein
LAVFTAFNILANYKFPLNEALCGIIIKNNIANISTKMPSMESEMNVAITIEEIVNAMDVIGFKDEGRDKVAEVVQDKFQELILGNTDCIPPELFEYVDTISEIVRYLLQAST